MLRSLGRVLGVGCGMWGVVCGVWCVEIIGFLAFSLYQGLYTLPPTLHTPHPTPLFSLHPTPFFPLHPAYL
jgi:hypothetical protein